jgi:hypothetical protein
MVFVYFGSRFRERQIALDHGETKTANHLGVVGRILLLVKLAEPDDPFPTLQIYVAGEIGCWAVPRTLVRAISCPPPLLSAYLPRLL